MKAGEIKAAAEKELFVGKKIKVFNFAKDKNGAVVLKAKRTGTVTGMYPHIFTAVMSGGYTESFRYSQLFEKEGEMVKT